MGMGGQVTASPPRLSAFTPTTSPQDLGATHSVRGIGVMGSDPT